MPKRSERKRSGGVLKAILIVLLLSAIVAATGFGIWLATRDNTTVTAYLRVPRVTSEFYFDAPPTLEEHRLRLRYHEALLLSPLVVEAALSHQEIIELDSVRQQRDPRAWITENCEISSPGDYEIIEVKLHCNGSRPDDCMKVVDAIVKAYQDKVLFEERIQSAAREASLRTAHKAFNEEIAGMLTRLLQMESEASTPAEKAKAAMLEDECEAARAINLRLQRLLSEFKVRKHLEVRQGHTGALNDSAQVIQHATVDD